MKLFFLLVCGSLLMAGEEGKCSVDTQTCLNLMVEKMSHKGWLGVYVETDGEKGPIIIKVMQDSPAERAGFKAGDILVGINGYRYAEKSPELQAQYLKAIPGNEATYLVDREGQEMEVKVVFGVWPEDLMYQHIGKHMATYHAQKPATN
ncbi:MAG: PDZ domain-containing protein [Acidobacteria bacterium]|nr:PDZ domain-containing protein [Acidobacteriota bacterium]MCB9398181.1 PDZ domain-containing protein [Acidobacteriota bacterium]